MAVLARADRPQGETGPSRHDRRHRLCHMGRGGVAGAGVPRPCATPCGREAPRPPPPAGRRDQPRRQQGGDGMGASGSKPQTGAQVIAITDTQGYLTPVPVARACRAALGFYPRAARAEAGGHTLVGLDRRGASSMRWGGDATTIVRGATAGLSPSRNPATGRPPRAGVSHWCCADSWFAHFLRGVKNCGRGSGATEVPHGRDPEHCQ
jgi:hypothetical protein